MKQPKIEKKYKANVPKADKDFDTLVTTVNQKWQQNTWLTLQWLTQVQFSQQVTSYSTTLDAKDSGKSSRGGITAQLAALDRKIDKGESMIKSYIDEEFDDNPEAHYAAFGIVRVGEALTIPHDRDERKKALKLIIPALTSFGFHNKKFGLAYWQDIADQYADMVTLASAKDGKTSTDAGAKNQHKASLKEALNSIIAVLKGNYPETWQQELRAWGFQKEKY